MASSQHIHKRVSPTFHSIFTKFIKRKPVSQQVVAVGRASEWEKRGNDAADAFAKKVSALAFASLESVRLYLVCAFLAK